MIWTGVEPEPLPELGFRGRVLMAGRLGFFVGMTMLLVTLWALAIGLEKLLGGRRLSGAVVRFWARTGHSVIGLKLEIEGEEMQHGGALMCNHASWSDIFVMHSAAHVFFVSKAEVAGWPVIGWLARITGTMFIERKSSEAAKQQAQLAARISAGDKLCIFPEATSTDSLRVLPFKSTLFESFLTKELKPLVWVQPVTISYFPPKIRGKRFYGWWGEMPFGPHAKVLLGLSRGGRVRVTFHPPLKAEDFETRKAYATATHEVVRRGLEQSLGDRFEDESTQG